MERTEYKDPPMELLDLRFDAKVLRRRAPRHKVVMCMPGIALSSSPHEYARLCCISTNFTQFIDTYDEAVKDYAMQSAGMKALAMFSSFYNDSDTLVPGESVFFAAVARNWKEGVKNGRSAFGWMDMDWTVWAERSYASKALRHLSHAEDPTLNITDRIKHLAAVYCNANILWHHCNFNWETPDEEVHEM